MTEKDPRVAFFDAHAPTWDTEGPPIEETLRRLAELEPELGLKSGLDLLEVGCGTGQVTAWLAQRVQPGRVTAIDFSSHMLEHARRRGVSADFRCVDVCTTPVGHQEYDLVFCMHVFPHFRDVAQALRHLSDSLRPGGSLIVLHLNSWREINTFHAHVGPPVDQDLLPEPDAWPGLLRVAGLQRQQLLDQADLFLLRAIRTN